MNSTRKHVRYNCEGSADLIANGHRRCWGTLGDISLGGFYVSNFDPLPISTAIIFKLQFGGSEVCGTGTVVTSHPGVGMGIMYQDLTTEHQHRLQSAINVLAGTSNPRGLGMHA